jgi:hypothetical protein
MYMEVGMLKMVSFRQRAWLNWLKIPLSSCFQISRATAMNWSAGVGDTSKHPEPHYPHRPVMPPPGQPKSNPS